MRNLCKTCDPKIQDTCRACVRVPDKFVCITLLCFAACVAAMFDCGDCPGCGRGGGGGCGDRDGAGDGDRDVDGDGDAECDDGGCSDGCVCCGTSRGVDCDCEDNRAGGGGCDCAEDEVISGMRITKHQHCK